MMTIAENVKPKPDCSLDKAEIYPADQNGEVETDSISCTHTRKEGQENVKENCHSFVLNKLKQDKLSCDLMWSLFISALLSYRRNTVLRPFPQKYCDVGEDVLLPDISGFKNFEKLKEIADEVPAITFILTENESDITKLRSSESMELLFWVLNTKSFSVKTVNNDMFKKIGERTGPAVDAPAPTLIFEVMYSEAVDSKFEGQELIYAYHGSRVENFHSILHNGLRNHMNKNSLFGEGTYLSSDLSVCMPYSPTGLGWKKSILGEKIGCIAVCEIINHPDVKCHTREAKKKYRAQGIRPGDILGDGIPEKYYIVQNDELVRIKYLYVYAEGYNSCPQRCSTVEPTTRSWLLEHKFIIMMITYLVVLFAVGFGDSRTFKSIFKKLTAWYK